MIVELVVLEDAVEGIRQVDHFWKPILVVLSLVDLLGAVGSTTFE